jgi:hypothetical protein
MKAKLKKGIDYKYKIPSYAPFKVGEIVRIANVRNLKRYAKSKEPYMNKLAVVIGYSTKSGAGPMTFAVRVIETGEEYLLYNYLLITTNQRTYVPKFDEGDELINISKKIDGKWMTVIEVLPNEEYKVMSHTDDKQKIVPEKALRIPTAEELSNKNIEQRLPELIGLF